MKLLRVDIQDGDNQYSKWIKCKDSEEALSLITNYTNEFMRAVRNTEVIDITQEEIEILKKFGVV
jgi:hypothetical protein